MNISLWKEGLETGLRLGVEPSYYNYTQWSEQNAHPVNECVTREQKTQKNQTEVLEMKTHMYLKMANLLGELNIKINQIKELLTIQERKSIQFEKEWHKRSGK